MIECFFDLSSPDGMGSQERCRRCERVASLQNTILFVELGDERVFFIKFCLDVFDIGGESVSMNFKKYRSALIGLRNYNTFRG